MADSDASMEEIAINDSGPNGSEVVTKRRKSKSERSKSSERRKSSSRPSSSENIDESTEKRPKSERSKSSERRKSSRQSSSENIDVPTSETTERRSKSKKGERIKSTASDSIELTLTDKSEIVSNNSMVPLGEFVEKPLSYGKKSSDDEEEHSESTPGALNEPASTTNLVSDKKSKKKDKKKKKEVDVKGPRVGLFTLYRFSSSIERVMMVLGIIGGLGHGVTQPVFAYILGRLFDELGGSAGFEDLIQKFNQLVLYLVYLAIASFVSSYFQTAMFTLVGDSQANKIREKYVEAILRQEVGWFDGIKSGELTTRLSSDVPLIRDAVSEKVGAFFQYFGMCISGYIIGFYSSWKVSLVIFGATPVLIIFVAIIGKFLTVFSNFAQKKYAAAGNIAQEVLSSVRTVMIFGGQVEEEQRFAAATKLAMDSGVKRSYFEAGGVAVMFALALSYYALAFWYGSTLINKGEITIGHVLTALFAIINASTSIGLMSPCLMTVNLGRGAAYEIFRVIDRKSEIDSLSPLGKRPEKCTGSISLRDIHFNYPSRPDIPILKGISLDIKSGQTVALVGKSGSGKSTIIGLIERFYNPLSGTIELDGMPIRDYNVQWLRSKIGLVGQEPILFAGTIAENIALGREGASMDEIIDASQQANAYDFIMKLPDKFDTFIQSKGSNLSGGQKQRIAIARALIKNPSILLLDEATSALDSKSEEIVQQALEKASKGRSTIVVAHRLATIKNADCIHVFDQGNILESGNHDELMKRQGVYYKLVQLQDVSQNETKKSSKKTKTESVIKAEKMDDPDEVLAVANEVEIDEQKVRLNSRMSGWQAYKESLKVSYASSWKLVIFGHLMAIPNGASYMAFATVFTKVLTVLSGETGPQLTKDAGFWCGMLVVVGVFQGIAVYGTNVSALITNEIIAKKIRDDLFARILRQPAAFFDKKGNEAAVFATSLAQDALQAPKLASKIPGSAIKIISLIVACLIMSLLSCWKLALVIAATIPILSLGQNLKIRTIKGFAIESRKAYERSGVVASEAIENVRTVYYLGLENFFLRRFHFEIEKPRQAAKKDGHAGGFGLGFGEAVQLLIFALGFYYGGQLMKSGDCEPESMIRTIFIVIFMGLVIGDQLHSFSDFSQALDAARTIFSYHKIPTEFDPNDETGEKPSNCLGEVEFRDVQFSYPTRQHIPVLKGMSFTVKPGQTIALVGHSGCGKSTTISLIEKLYKYSGGSVVVDGRPVDSLNTNWIRSQIGYVGQEPAVFARTIKENILYGYPASDQELHEACIKANIQSFIMGLPDKFDTYVGERGAQLSGGQKQRIAIARALVRNPKILLLDEATSALDSESEKLVQGAINQARKGRTTIVIAHRLSTIRDADIIAVVNNGRVVEVGNHNSLIEKRGEYFNYVQAQSLDNH